MRKTAIAAALLAMACTDAECSKYGALGSNAEVECYSGGKLIYSGTSSGKVASEGQSDGYYFRDRATGRIVEVSADCVFRLK